MNEEINKIINWIEMSYTRLNYKEELLLVNYIKQLQQENARLKDKLNKINDLLNEPIFEYDNIPCNIENEIIQLKDILKEN